MPSASRSITINRPVDVVFAFLADGVNGTKWRSGVLHLSRVSGQGVGEVWRQGVKGPGGRRIAADYEITAHEPPRRLGVKAIAGPVRPTGDYRLEPAGEDATKITFSLEEELSGWKKWLLGGQVQKTMDAEMAALDKLKAVLEAG